MINNKWMHTYLTLVEIGHFTKAADKLFMTQPGVSQHIKKLEEQIGTPLLVKFGKQFELTNAGEIIHQLAITRRNEELLLLEQLHHNDPLSGVCRFACSGSLALYLYPIFLDYQALYPNLNIHFEVGPNTKIIQDLLNKKVDIGIVAQQKIPKELTRTSLGFEKLNLIVPTSLKNQLHSFEDLNQLGIIDHPDCKHYAEQLLPQQYADFKSIENIKKTGYINQLNQILLPVSQGLGYTVLPEKAMSCFEKQEKIAVLKTNVEIQEELFMLTKRHRPLPSRYQWFQQKLLKLF